MANTAGMAPTFAAELLQSVHAFNNGVVRASTAGDTFKGALYLTSATIGPSTATYTSTGEVTGAGYTAGGVAFTFGAAPSVSGDSGIVTPSASLTFTGVTIGPTDAVLMYNSSQGDKSVGVYTFGAVTVVAGNLTLTMPVNAAGTALIEIDTTP